MMKMKQLIVATVVLAALAGTASIGPIIASPQRTAA